MIAQTFSTVLDNTEQRVQRKLESETDNYRRSSYKKKYCFWKYIQEEFGECIKLNIEILTMKNKIRPLLNANFLLIYYSTAVILANGAIYLSQMKTATLFSLQTLSYCVWICFDCALLTRMVNLLTEAVSFVDVTSLLIDLETVNASKVNQPVGNNLSLFSTVNNFFFSLNFTNHRTNPSAGRCTTWTGPGSCGATSASRSSTARSAKRWPP